jgi:hypothetical protein
MYVYIDDGTWRRFNMEALVRCPQEVEFQDETNREREDR